MIWPALILGFAGSLHCVGMCSPLAMAVTNFSSHALLNRLIYNSGRIIVYGILGTIMASAGWIIPIDLYQNAISIALGVILLLISAAGLGSIRIPLITQQLSAFNILLKKLFSKFISRKNRLSMFLLGGLNALLPCGLSFLALTSCITLTSPVDGFLFMILFGVGTLPAMLGLASIVPWISSRLKFSSFQMTRVLLVISGLLLIGRVFVVHNNHNSMNEQTTEIVICR